MQRTSPHPCPELTHSQSQVHSLLSGLGATHSGLGLRTGEHSHGFTPQKAQGAEQACSVCMESGAVTNKS